MIFSTFILTNKKGPNPVQQLTCVDDQNLCNSYSPIQVICSNPGVFVKWRCNAQLDAHVQFKNTEVVCEKDPESLYDDSVYVGSCGLM